MQKKASSTLARPAFYYAVFSLSICVYQNYAPLYLRARGLSPALLGVAQAIAALTALVALPLWGVLADRAKRRVTVLFIALAGAAGALLLYPIGENPAMLLLWIAIFSFFQLSLPPLSDTLCLESVDQDAARFGRVRLFGTLALALSAPVFALILKPSPLRFVPAASLTFLAGLAAAFVLPRSKENAQRAPIRPLDLLKDKKRMLMLAYAALLQFALAFYFTYFPLYFTNSGASEALLGWAYFISAISEVPFLLLSGVCVKRFGAAKLLAFAGFMLVVRFVLAAFFPYPAALLVTQALHGLGPIIIAVALATTLIHGVPKQMKASGQMLIMLTTYALARALGNLFAGALTAFLPLEWIFLVLAALVLVPTCLWRWRICTLRNLN